MLFTFGNNDVYSLTVSNIVKKGHRMYYSLSEIFAIGIGPSSSHTVGPMKAACRFVKNLDKKIHDVASVDTYLYGSLALTGKGHGTDRVIEKTLAPASVEVLFDLTQANIPHPNTMDIIGFKNNVQIASSRVISIGGGSILFENETLTDEADVYREHTFCDIAEYCKSNSIPKGASL